MERLTRRTGHGWQVEEGRLEEALERLARFEDVFQSLVEEQEQLEAEMEPLRAVGRQKSARFRELLGKKLVNQQLLIRLEFAGIY